MKTPNPASPSSRSKKLAALDKHLAAHPGGVVIKTLAPVERVSSPLVAACSDFSAANAAALTQLPVPDVKSAVLYNHNAYLGQPLTQNQKRILKLKLRRLSEEALMLRVFVEEAEYGDDVSVLGIDNCLQAIGYHLTPISHRAAFGAR